MSPLLTTLPPVVLDTLFWTAVGACAVAQLFILRAVWRVLPGPDGAAVSPAVPTPRRAPELAWALLPAVLLIVLFVGAWRRMHPVTTTLPAVAPAPIPSLRA